MLYLTIGNFIYIYIYICLYTGLFVDCLLNVNTTRAGTLTSWFNFVFLALNTVPGTSVDALSMLLDERCYSRFTDFFISSVPMYQLLQ